MKRWIRIAAACALGIGAAIALTGCDDEPGAGAGTDVRVDNSTSVRTDGASADMQELKAAAERVRARR